MCNLTLYAPLSRATESLSLSLYHSYYSSSITFSFILEKKKQNLFFYFFYFYSDAALMLCCCFFLLYIYITTSSSLACAFLSCLRCSSSFDIWVVLSYPCEFRHSHTHTHTHTTKQNKTTHSPIILYFSYTNPDVSKKN